MLLYDRDYRNSRRRIVAGGTRIEGLPNCRVVHFASFVLYIMSKEVDVNNVFEKLLMSEDLSARIDYKKGYKVGKRNLLQGYHLGYHKTCSVATQLGYYKGELLKIPSRSALLKVDLQKKNLLSNIYNFPAFNDSSNEIEKSFDNIKFNFNKFCSMTKSDVGSTEKNKLDF